MCQVSAWYHEEAKSSADKQITSDMSKYLVESGTYTWVLREISNNEDLARVSKTITITAEKLPTPVAPSVSIDGTTLKFSGEYDREDVESLWLFGYYTWKDSVWQFEKKLKLTNDGKYSGTLDLTRYSGLQSQGVENIFFKVRMIPKDTSKNALSDYSEASVKLSIAGIFNQCHSVKHHFSVFLS